MTKEQILEKITDQILTGTKFGVKQYVKDLSTEKLASYLATIEERLEKVEGRPKTWEETLVKMAAGDVISTPTEKVECKGNSNLRDNADGTCNCRPFMGGCFFTDGFDGKCGCKCHTPTPTEKCCHGTIGNCYKCEMIRHWSRLEETPTEVKECEHEWHRDTIFKAHCKLCKAEKRFIRPEVKDWEVMYKELIMAVESKYEGETRHETALRYIRQTEALKEAEQYAKQNK